MPVIKDIVAIKGKPGRRGILRKFIKHEGIVHAIVMWWPWKGKPQHSSLVNFELLETVQPREKRGRPKKAK